jgi:hypothetical protein
VTSILAHGIEGYFDGLNPLLMGVILPTTIIFSHKRMKIQGTKLVGYIVDTTLDHIKTMQMIFWKSTAVHPQPLNAYDVNI